MIKELFATGWLKAEFMKNLNRKARLEKYYTSNPAFHKLNYFTTRGERQILANYE